MNLGPRTQRGQKNWANCLHGEECLHPDRAERHRLLHLSHLDFQRGIPRAPRGMGWGSMVSPPPPPPRFCVGMGLGVYRQHSVTVQAGERGKFIRRAQAPLRMELCGFVKPLFGKDRFRPLRSLQSGDLLVVDMLRHRPFGLSPSRRFGCGHLKMADLPLPRNALASKICAPIPRTLSEFGGRDRARPENCELHGLRRS